MADTPSPAPEAGAPPDGESRLVVTFGADGAMSWRVEGQVGTERLVNALAVAHAFFVQAQLGSLRPKERVRPAGGGLFGLDGRPLRG